MPDPMSAETAERNYNLRAAVPEHPQWFARWAEDSARARAAGACLLDLRYGTQPGSTVDVFPAQRSRGLHVFIHGGYWRALDKDDHSFVAPAFVAAGISVAVVNYDLCPGVTIPQIVEQCRSAIAWLLNDGGALGVPGGPVVISGHSAGGHLAAMLFATDWAARGVDPGRIAGALAVSGVFDLEPLRQVSFNADLRIDAEVAARASPARLEPRLAAPLWLVVGGDETPEFHRQSRLLHERWPSVRPRGSEGPLVLPGLHHFSVIAELGREGSPLFGLTESMFPSAD